MGLFDLFKRANMDESVQLWRDTQGAILLDVRTKEEFAGGHIDGAVNLPLQLITRAEEQFPDLQTPIFVHCQSGARSAQAVRILKEMGYENAVNIGGMNSWHGEVVR